MLHYTAWKKGLKSLYYCRSSSMQRADKVSHKVPEIQMEMSLKNKQETTYEECLACQ
jgi:ribonucleoside-diphosphate reductase alpha chain